MPTTMELAPCCLAVASSPNGASLVRAPLLEPVAVRYAQHARVIAYGWSELEERWRNLPRPTSPTLGPV